MASVLQTASPDAIRRIQRVQTITIAWMIRASAVPSAAGRPAKKADGLVTADTNGTRSIPGECAPRASTNGLRRSAFLVAAGRHTRIGTRSESGQCLLERARQPRFRALQRRWLSS